MPVMFAFHMMSPVSGPGPAENLVAEASPSNCGHSYWSKFSSSFPVALVIALWAFATFPWKLVTKLTSERTRIRAMTATYQSCDFRGFLISKPQQGIHGVDWEG